MPRRKLGEPPDKRDVALGARIRALRDTAEPKLSQGVVATAVGISFQQLQKYERGVNRIGFARLCDIATALGTNVADLVAPVAAARGVEAHADYLEIMHDPEAMLLLARFKTIGDPRRRKAIMAMIKELASGG